MHPKPMATTIEEVKQFLNEEGKKFREIPGKNFIRTGFITDNYTDNEGEKLCSLVVAVEEAVFHDGLLDGAPSPPP